MTPGWIINVCRTCGRIATWPFCEHRDEPQPEGRSWCVGILVKPVTQEGREMARLNSERVIRERHRPS